MPWEVHGSKRYYYRRRKVGGRIVKKYIGGGLLGEMAFMADMELRLAREQNQALRKAESQGRSLAEMPLTTVTNKINLLLRSLLLGTGRYRQHYRGEWRSIHENPDSSWEVAPAPVGS